MKNVFHLEIKDAGVFLAKGNLDHKNPETAKLADLIRSAVAARQKITESYDRALLNDQKLIGQEKAALLVHVHSLIRVLISIRLHLLYSFNPGSFANGVDLDENYHFKIYHDDYKYTVTGKLSEKRLYEINSFQSWNSEYTEMFQTFLSQLKSALDDNKISPDEVESCNDLLDKQALRLYMIYWQLHNGSIHS